MDRTCRHHTARGRWTTWAILATALAGALAAGDRTLAGAPTAPGEFFMVDEAVSPISDEGGPPVLLSPAEAVPIPPAPAATGEPPAAASEFFMRDDAQWTPTPAYDGEPGPAAATVAPRTYVQGYRDWNSVPASVMPGRVEHGGGSFESAFCACEERWVNWRCGTEHLEGCMPEGFNGMPMIFGAFPFAAYNGPLNPGAPTEPGGTSDNLAQKAGLNTKPITALTTNIAVNTVHETPPLESLADVPVDRVHVPGTQRAWNGVAYYWDASHLIHQPLYFEDVNLERYGYSYGCVQPLVSYARFLVRIPMLPYAMAVHPHYKAEYALGYARPGSPAPYVHLRPPVSGCGALVEAGVVTGLFFAIP